MKKLNFYNIGEQFGFMKKLDYNSTFFIGHAPLILQEFGSKCSWHWDGIWLKELEEREPGTETMILINKQIVKFI